VPNIRNKLAFDLYDLNGDGLITYHDIDAFFESVGGSIVPPEGPKKKLTNVFSSSNEGD
jgi:Ca2+-binding EF-hand superfamily protein